MKQKHQGKQNSCLNQEPVEGSREGTAKQGHGRDYPRPGCECTMGTNQTPKPGDSGLQRECMGDKKMWILQIPQENQHLLKALLETGAAVSENPK